MPWIRVLHTRQTGVGSYIHRVRTQYARSRALAAPGLSHCVDPLQGSVGTDRLAAWLYLVQPSLYVFTEALQ